MNLCLRRRLAEFLAREDGALAPILSLLLVVLVGMTGMAIDVGRAMWVERQLQSSSDAAALAGALSVADNATTASNTAKAYSGTAGNFNAVRGATSVSIIDNPDGTPKVWCSTKVSPVCASTFSGKNVIKVTQQAVVPMYFLRLVGMPTMTPRATATASARGGSGRSLDVVIVMDTTYSMSFKDANCGISNASKLTCAKAGAYAMLQGLNPALDRVSYMVFPPLTTAGVAASTTCNQTLQFSSGVATYNAVATGASGATYAVFGLAYPKYGANGKLDPTSTSMIASGKGGSNCTGGIQTALNTATPDYKSTYFADAIGAATTLLIASDRPKSQKVIVMLSDGDANAPEFEKDGDRYMANNRARNQCQRAIANARAATAAGIWVYSVAYGAETTRSYCETDTQIFSESPLNLALNLITPCRTMREIASESRKFYSDGANGCNADSGQTSNNLITLFQNISSDLTQPRLWPESSV